MKVIHVHCTPKWASFWLFENGHSTDKILVIWSYLLQYFIRIPPKVTTSLKTNFFRVPPAAKRV